jgi:hypothetical protein
MAKRNPTKFVQECIENCWAGQKAMIDEESDDYKALTARVEAFQEVHVFLTDDEYDGSSEVLPDDESPIPGEDDEPKVVVVDDEEEEDDEEEPTPET